MTPAEERKVKADEKLIARLGFTPAQAVVLRACVSGVWNEVAYDILTATAEEKGKDVDAVTVSRAVAIEVSLDAGRPEERMRLHNRNAAKHNVPTELTEEVIARWEGLSYEDRQAFVKPCFPYSRYGA